MTPVKHRNAQSRLWLIGQERCERARLIDRQHPEDRDDCIPNLLGTAAAATLLGSLAGACAKSDQANAVDLSHAAAAATARPKLEQRKSASTHAVDLLVAVDRARTALGQNNKGAAVTFTDSAQNALAAIGSVPLVPIYSELSEASFVGPIQAAKKSPSTSTSKAPKAEAVQAVTTGYSRILLDTSATRKLLNQARSELAKNDLAAADRSLKMLQQSVVLESSATRLPLVRARENLSLAAAAAGRKNWSEVKAELTAASKGLQDYAKRAPLAQVADVRVLQQQIASFMPVLDSHQDQAAERINQWWVQAANLSDSAA